jgi:hypothetical protein
VCCPSKRTVMSVGLLECTYGLRKDLRMLTGTLAQLSMGHLFASNFFLINLLPVKSKHNYARGPVCRRWSLFDAFNRFVGVFAGPAGRGRDIEYW